VEKGFSSLSGGIGFGGATVTDVRGENDPAAVPSGYVPRRTILFPPDFSPAGQKKKKDFSPAWNSQRGMNAGREGRPE
jgi:hypothetical protein